MAKKKSATGWDMVGKAAKGLAEQGKQAEKNLAESRSAEVIPLDSITLRQVDTRPADPAHVVALTESLTHLGLIEPLVIDQRNRLLAGLHRYNAAKICLEPDPDQREKILIELGNLYGAKIKASLIEAVRSVDHQAALKQFPGSHIPIRRVDIDAVRSPDKALAIEVAENEKRRDYTKQEVVQLADRLQEAGYRNQVGKPQAGQKALGPALSIIIGKSQRTVRRILSPDISPTKKSDPYYDSLQKLHRALNDAQRHLGTNDQLSKKINDLQLLVISLTKTDKNNNNES